MEVIWPIHPGMGNITCDGEYACSNVNFPVPHPSTPYIFRCDSTGECQSSDIYCPSNAECTINCVAGYACVIVCICCLKVFGCCYC